MQQVIVILAVAACALWLGYYVYRFFHPRSGRTCGGGCCDAGNKPATKESAGSEKSQSVFFSSDDLVARIKARKS